MDSFDAARLAEKNIHLIYEDHGADPTADVDRDQLTQVIVNLIKNGIEAMENKGGEIRVNAVELPEQGRVQITVSDQGCGIPPEDRERIFQPFFTTKNIGKGVGLGLPICYGIVKMHRGKSGTTRLWAEAPFSILNYQKPNRLQEGAWYHEFAQEDPFHRRRPRFLRSQSIFFSTRGYQVLTAESTEEALKVLEKETPDLIFLDLMMEHFDTGFTLSHQIRKDSRFQSIPMVMLSGVASATGHRFDQETEGCGNGPGWMPLWTSR